MEEFPVSGIDGPECAEPAGVPAATSVVKRTFTDLESDALTSPSQSRRMWLSKPSPNQELQSQSSLRAHIRERATDLWQIRQLGEFIQKANARPSSSVGSSVCTCSVCRVASWVLLSRTPSNPPRYMWDKLLLDFKQGRGACLLTRCCFRCFRPDHWVSSCPLAAIQLRVDKVCVLCGLPFGELGCHWDGDEPVQGSRPCKSFARNQLIPLAYFIRSDPTAVLSHPELASLVRDEDFHRWLFCRAGDSNLDLPNVVKFVHWGLTKFYGVYSDIESTVASF